MNSSDLSFYSVKLAPLLADYQRAFPIPPTRAPLELAAAISHSELLADTHAVVALRESSSTLVIAVEPNDTLALALRVISTQLKETIRRVRYIDWERVQSAVRRLADRLAEQLGEPFLQTARFQAIPRGGHLVLGLLAYEMALRPDQLSPDSSSRLVVVDDCALSGLRFKETIGASGSDEIVFATLFSPPALRDAIEEAESRVVACVSGEDIADLTEQLPESERLEWRERWRSRGEVYWMGQPEHLVFPWGEAGLAMWDSDNEKVVQGWRVAPPSLVISRGRDMSGAPEVQIANEGKGDVKLAEDVVHAGVGDDVAVFHLGDGRAIQLEGPAARMWEAILGEPSLEDAARRIASSFEVDQSTALADAEGFVADLEARGLVTKPAT